MGSIPSLSTILSGDFLDERINAPSAKVIAELMAHLASKEISADEAKNIARFLKLIPADVLSGMLRDLGSIRGTNITLLMKECILREFVERVK